MAKKAAAAQRVGLRYIGGGSYLPGLPARDLSAADLVEYGAIIAVMAQAGTLGQLYEEVASFPEGTHSATVTEGEGVTNA